MVPWERPSFFLVFRFTACKAFIPDRKATDDALAKHLEFSVFIFSSVIVMLSFLFKYIVRYETSRLKTVKPGVVMCFPILWTPKITLCCNSVLRIIIIVRIFVVKRKKTIWEEMYCSPTRTNVKIKINKYYNAYTLEQNDRSFFLLFSLMTEENDNYFTIVYKMGFKNYSSVHTENKGHIKKHCNFWTTTIYFYSFISNQFSL